MGETRTVHCDGLGQKVTLRRSPRRIVSLVSFATESLEAMGFGSRIVGVSEFCSRYAPTVEAPVAGDYLACDEEGLRKLEPDLVLLTSGAQRRLGERLARAGFPVFVLPLPSSIFGILENVLLLGGLTDEMAAARHLAERWRRAFGTVEQSPSVQRPRVVAELWIGRFARMAGGLTYVHDTIEAAGGDNAFGSVAEAYMELDVSRMAEARPDIWLLFSEPEYPIDAEALRRERGWDRTLPGLGLIRSVVDRGRNVIHDGPSMMDTVSWLRQEFQLIK